MSLSCDLNLHPKLYFRQDKKVMLVLGRGVSQLNFKFMMTEIIYSDKVLNHILFSYMMPLLIRSLIMC